MPKKESTSEPNKIKVEFMSYLDPEQIEKFYDFLAWLKEDEQNKK